MYQARTSLRTAFLVVEDEVLLRMNLADMTNDAGFPTYEAGNAEEALELMERHPEIGVLFTDVNMPGSMDGLTLAQTVRERWPHVRIIVTSGRLVAQSTQLPSEAIFIGKPYRMHELDRMFARISDRTEAPVKSADCGCSAGNR
jgi:CheY-like chemotaxis protein